MKIAIITNLFPPSVLAGTELASYNIAKGLAKRGHEVHVITSEDTSLQNEYQTDGFHVHRIKHANKYLNIRVIGFFYNFLCLAVFYLDCLPCIRKINPDIINAQQIEMGIPGFLAGIFLKIPYIIYGRGVYFSDIQIFFRQLHKIALQNAAAVIVLTESMKQTFKKDYKGAIHVVPNGIDLDRFQDISRLTSRKELGINEDQKIVLYAGRLRDYKGVQFLITAMSKITHNVPHSKLLIVGDDQGEKQKIMKMIEVLKLEQTIQLFDQVVPEKVLFFMAAADVFVLPTLREGFPNVLLEAMGSGLPIVCTNVDGLPEIVKDGENGFLVQPKNSEQLADKIIALLSDSRLAEQISKNNLEKIKDFEMDNIISQLEEVYSKYI